MIIDSSTRLIASLFGVSQHLLHLRVVRVSDHLSSESVGLDSGVAAGSPLDLWCWCCEGGDGEEGKDEEGEDGTHDYDSWIGRERLVLR